MTDNLAARIRREFGTTTPDATVPEVLGALDLPPDRAGDVADELNQQSGDEGGDTGDVLVNNASEEDTDETAENRPPDGGSPRSNPGKDADASRSTGPAFQYDDLRYIELRDDGSKLPAKAWGGYSREDLGATGDLSETPHVYTAADIQKHPAENWGVVDVLGPDHARFALLVFDIDIHKAPDGFDPDRIEVPDDTLLVRSQNGGFHAYFILSGYERGALQESDFQLTTDPGFDIDIRGSVVSHHVVAPSDIPGAGGPYEVVNDDTITAVYEPQAAAERITLDGAPLVEFDPAGGVDSYNFDVPEEPPEDMPTCYHAGLELRKAAPDDHPNTHKVNMLTAACGLAAGYDPEDVAGHFCGDWAPMDGDVDLSDKETTKYQVQHIKDGRYSAPAESTLRDYGILDDDEHCEGCPIEYHGAVGERGARGESESIAVLPPAVRDLSHATTGWDWHHAGRRDADDDDPLQAVRDRTTEEIVDALESFDLALVAALMTTGKSYGAVKAVAETGEPATILTGRGNVEQYDQIKEWADEFDLEVYTLPSFTRDCDTANGEHGEEWKETVRDWYRRGATPQEIHAHAEYHLGRPLPCQAHDGQECPYTSAWRFDPDDYDILLGHYSHAYNQSEKVTVDRAVLIDEFPGDAYERALGGGILKGAVTQYLQARDALPFDDYTDLLEHRDDDARRADALAALTDGDLEPDTGAVFQDRSAHADAPLAVFTILAAAENNLGNGLERAPFPGDDDRVGIHDRGGVFSLDDDGGGVRVLDPPPLEYARSVVALDGTPTPEMWELTLGVDSPGPLGDRMTHRRVLTDDERREYVRDLNLNVVRTTEYVKPYNNPDHVAVDRDLALLEAVRDHHGQDPGLITTQTALDEYEQAGALEYDPDTGEVRDGPADRVTWRGNVLGSNEFADTRLGVVTGSNHYGDHYIKKWGAYAAEAVERDAADEDKPAKGENLTYGAFGDKIHRHMAEHDTLQAVMRFGRDGNGAVVYCHTDTLPEWVPIAAEGRVVDTWSDGERQVLEAAEDLTKWTTADLAAHPAVEIGERQVFNILDDLADRDVLAREWDGRGYRWTDDGLEDTPEYGEVDLPTTAEGMVDLNAVDDETVQEMGRNSTYTWYFLNRPAGDCRDDRADGSNGGEAAVATADGADRPPDPGD